MATRSDDIDMARRALDLADSWGSVDLDAGQIVELANALRDAWRLGRKSDPRDVLEAAHALRLLGCEGESAVEVMVDAARLLGVSADPTIADQAWGLADAIDGARGNAGRARELIKDALRAAWRAGHVVAQERGAPEEHQASAEAYQRDILGAATLDAHAECAEELRAVGCRGETTTAVMTHAVERIRRADAAAAEGNRVIEELARRADRDAGVVRETIATLQNDQREAEDHQSDARSKADGELLTRRWGDNFAAAVDQALGRRDKQIADAVARIDSLEVREAD